MSGPDARLGVAWIGAEVGRDTARAVRLAGSPERLWRAPVPFAARLLGLGPDGASALAAARRRFDAERARAELADLGVVPLGAGGRPLPPGIGDLVDPPAVLFARGGAIDPAGGPVVGIVGTRRPTVQGGAFARALAAALAARGATVVSGLALGVDAAAHRGALDAGGRTVAVLAGGVDAPSPLRNRDLADRIVAEGCLLSEYWPGTRPTPWRFPARNRIVAALSEVVVVVEAGEGSGALITADFALELGRPVLAVPGPPWAAASRGCNELIRAGAGLCERVDDVLNELPDRHWAAAIGIEDGGASADAEAAAVIEELRRGPARADELAERLGIPAAALAAVLALLEIEGRVLRGEAQRYWAAPDVEAVRRGRSAA